MFINNWKIAKIKKKTNIVTEGTRRRTIGTTETQTKLIPSRFYGINYLKQLDKFTKLFHRAFVPGS